MTEQPSATVALQAHPQGVVLPVRARPGARRNELRGVHDGQLRVSVTQAPEKGKANQAIIAVLCERLGLRKSQVSVLSGETAPQKRLLIAGLEIAELRARLRAALG